MEHNVNRKNAETEVGRLREEGGLETSGRMDRQRD